MFKFQSFRHEFHGNNCVSSRHKTCRFVQRHLQSGVAERPIIIRSVVFWGRLRPPPLLTDRAQFFTPLNIWHAHLPRHKQIAANAFHNFSLNLPAEIKNAALKRTRVTHDETVLRKMSKSREKRFICYLILSRVEVAVVMMSSVWFRPNSKVLLN